MKKICILLMFAMPTLLHAADNDTVIINKPKSVTVITGDSIQEILVKGREGDEGFTYRDRIKLKGNDYSRETFSNRDLKPKLSLGNKKNSKVDVTGHFAFGMVLPTNVSSGMDFPGGKSWEIYFSPLDFEFYLNKSKRDYISFGIGFDWRNYRMTDKTRFVKIGDDQVGLGTYPEGADPKFSRVKVFSLSFPLLFQHEFGKDWGFGLGPVLNWNTYGSLKTKYKMDGGEHKFTDKHIGQRKITVDFMALFKNPLFDIYLKYCPTDVLKDSDLKFRSLSFGFYL
ncbi:MAG: hypothetical protein J6Y97_14390 [Prevotella sp.]|nr:hypothetical protein [Prevotella sp.]MBP5507006.1 hypothetical protein [Prevotella sp.]